MAKSRKKKVRRVKRQVRDLAVKRSAGRLAKGGETHGTHMPEVTLEAPPLPPPSLGLGALAAEAAKVAGARAAAV